MSHEIEFQYVQDLNIKEVLASMQMCTDELPGLWYLSNNPERLSECDSPGMWTDKDGEYVRYTEHKLAVDGLLAALKVARSWMVGLTRDSEFVYEAQAVKFNADLERINQLIIAFENANL